MLKKRKQSTKIEMTSVIEVKEGEEVKEVEVETYSCSIDNEHPEKMTMSKYFAGTAGQAAYKDNRAACRADYQEFTQIAQNLQDEMFALTENTTE
jgi:hypothetical protein